jgi:3-isopropylmalate dehydrogenase
MLDWLGETSMAVRLESSIAKVIKDGKVRTYDMGGTNTSLEVAEAVARGL